ncbi:MAG: tetratricopeptide repeat protein [Planctomycetota bacterium]|jgi:tetratricopeptide (TPR) repeat protein
MIAYHTGILLLQRAAIAASFLIALVSIADAQEVMTAREHLQHGRYEEAEEAYAKLVASNEESIPARVGLARSLVALGRLDDALTGLKSDNEDAGQHAPLLAEQARIRLSRGELDVAQEIAESVLKQDDDNLLARLVRARVLVERGEIDEANIEFRWFVRYYNRKQPTDAETLLLVAEGAAEYARWNSVSSIFNFIVNTLCPDALQDDPSLWQAHLLSGELLLEKYNRAQAIPDVKRALVINPRAVEALVAVGRAALDKHDVDRAARFADQALEIQSRSVPAMHLKADAILTRGDLHEAVETLSQAREVNPVDQATLGRLAACQYLLDLQADSTEQDQRLQKLFENLDAIDDVVPESPTAIEQIVIDVARRNPRPGQFLSVFGERLETRRKYALVETVYQHAIRVMPQLSQPKTRLGMLYMQTGRTDEAKTLLDDAFRADPYHVRVSNMRKVLDVLNGYRVITTDHFVIRVDSTADEILGTYMAEYLEEVYAELVAKYGFEPPQRTTFEIYHNAKGQSAHQWFSARMVGLPWIQTVGASTGMMVALTSPTAANKPFNWARVVKHEFVHIVTLQQTRFNIPHWFTEALAVTSEEIRRPAIWNQLLLQRVPAGDLWSLDELTPVFQRPETPLDWQFAYCQSRLYAQYIIETFGEECIAKMLDCYRRNLSTNQAISKVFEMPPEEFDAGYRKFLQRLVDDMSGVPVASPKSIADLEKEYEADRENPAAMAAYASALLQARRRKQARELAEQAIEKNPTEPLAAVVLAQLELVGRDFDGAAGYLEQALDREIPHAGVLGLLARVRLLQRRPQDAADLYELGRKKLNIGQHATPLSNEWLKGLAAAYLQLEDNERLEEILTLIAQLDADNISSRRKLAQLADERGDVDTAGKWAGEVIQIDVTDIDAHRLRAKFYDATGDDRRAQRERQFVEQLSSK